MQRVEKKGKSLRTITEVTIFIINTVIIIGQEV